MKMRIILIVFFSITMAINVFCQYNNFQIILGGKGVFYSSFLLNKNIADIGDEQNTDLSFGNSYGFMGGIHIPNSSIGIEVEFQKAFFQQKYYSPTQNYESYTDLEFTNIPVLLKLSPNYAGYLELGVQFSSVKRAWHTFEFTNLNTYTEKDCKTDFSKSNTSLLLGFGTNFNLYNDQLYLRAGARLSYGISDIIGVDAYGISMENQLLYDPYEATHTATVGLLVGLTYQFDL